jgi:hypothetical protein
VTKKVLLNKSTSKKMLREKELLEIKMRESQLLSFSRRLLITANMQEIIEANEDISEKEIK